MAKKDEEKKKKGNTGSAPVSRANRNAARASKFKNTTEARAGGMVLPTAEELAAQKLKATRPVKDVGAQARRIVDEEQEPPKRGGRK